MSQIPTLEANLERTVAARAAKYAELQAVPVPAETEERAMTDDETARTDALIAEVTALDSEADAIRARIDSLREIERRADLAAKAPVNITTDRRQSDPFANLPERSMMDLAASDARDMALRTFENARGFQSDAHRDALLDKIHAGGPVGVELARLALATGSDAYRSAWLKTATGRMLNYEDVRLIERAQTSGTASSGGVLVPIQIDPTIFITGNGVYSPVNQLATQKTTPGTSYRSASINALSAIAASAESAAITESTQTTTEINIPVYKYAVAIRATFEAFEDIDNLAADVGQLFARGVAESEDTLFTTGSGSSTVSGVVTAVALTSGSRVACTTVGQFGLVDVYKLHQNLPPSARMGADPAKRAFLANVVTINTIRQFATANNYHGFLVDLGGGNPPVLLGDQFFESSPMTSTLTTSNDFMIYGDFSRYVVVRKQGFTTEYIPNVVDGAGTSIGQRELLGWWRVGGDSVDDNAFRVLRTS